MILKIQKTPESMVSNIVSNNGTKFKNHDLLMFFQKEGISHLVTSPYTPQQNPISERGNQTTINKARCLLKDSGLPLLYWAEAVNTSVHLESLTPNSAISFGKPFKRWHHKKQSLNHLHNFGFQAIYYNYINGKFSNRGVKGTLLGYGEGHHSFQILDMEKGSLGLLFHDNPDPLSDQYSLLLFNPPTESRIDSLTLSSIETEHKTNSSSSIPSIDLPKNKGYTWIMDTSTPNQNKIIGNIDLRNVLNSSRRHTHSINSVSCLYPNPKTYLQAIHSPEKDFWINTIKSELNKLGRPLIIPLT
ncbi:hypothetical protein O181_086132 [Austropuccinia psidii MF-1]|uniref:Integrase catalytic domain-containing protein n=1 Tax=Austropuccinia psidii MF-1 TaxID=1389203 RepID=A0A9Q3IM77_9BASI|nr:hypothetical protein [Austropuccinia psidii MF-1]